MLNVLSVLFKKLLVSGEAFASCRENFTVFLSQGSPKIFCITSPFWFIVFYNYYFTKKQEYCVEYLVYTALYTIPDMFFSSTIFNYTTIFVVKTAVAYTAIKAKIHKFRLSKIFFLSKFFNFVI